MRHSILCRTKILTSSNMILWGNVGFFCDRDLYTFRPRPFVGLNSESQKSLELFIGFQLSHGDSHDQKKLRRGKYIDSMEDLRWNFSTQVSHLRVPAPCRILCDFRFKNDNSKWLSNGRHPASMGTISGRPHTSKTIPGHEKKPNDNRHSHGGERCRILLLPIFERHFRVDSEQKVSLQRNPLDRSS